MKRPLHENYGHGRAEPGMKISYRVYRIDDIPDSEE
jgi:hypothetical protein